MLQAGQEAQQKSGVQVLPSSLAVCTSEVLKPISWGICRSHIHHHEFQEVRKRGREGGQPVPFEVYGVLLFLFHCPESSQMGG